MVHFKLSSLKSGLGGNDRDSLTKSLTEIMHQEMSNIKGKGIQSARMRLLFNLILFLYGPKQVGLNKVQKCHQLHFTQKFMYLHNPELRAGLECSLPQKLMLRVMTIDDSMAWIVL